MSEGIVAHYEASESTEVALRPTFFSVPYDEMRRKIQDTNTFYEAKQIVDITAAAAEYARQANDPELRRVADEFKLRAERKCGEFLAKMQPKSPGRPVSENKHSSKSNVSSQRTLKEMGLTGDQSSTYQKLAAVPQDTYDNAVANAGSRIPSAREVIDQHERKPAPKVDRVDPLALWLWGHLVEFERRGVLHTDPNVLLTTMLDHMEATTLELAPRVAEWVARLGKLK